MDEENNPTKAKQPRKIADQLELAINEVVNSETMKAMDQEVSANILRILHHTRWWQVLDPLLISRVAITMIYMII